MPLSLKPTPQLMCVPVVKKKKKKIGFILAFSLESVNNGLNMFSVVNDYQMV